MSSRSLALRIMAVFLPMAACLPAYLIAADPAIVERNLFSPERKAEERGLAPETRPAPPPVLQEDAILLRGVSIHDHARWALLAIRTNLLPQDRTVGKGATPPGGGKIRPQAMPRNRAGNRERTTLLVREGGTIGEFLLQTVAPDHVLVLKDGSTLRLELRNPARKERASP